MRYRTLYSVAVAILVLVSFPLIGRSANPVTVDILYMNHGPLRPTVEQIRQVLSDYGDKVNSSWYDFESKEGEKFMAQKGIRQHIPLVIWVNGKSTVPVEGRDIQLMGFPSGSGPAAFQGKWTMTDLRKALDQLTDKK
jgi:hypothetical protein